MAAKKTTRKKKNYAAVVGLAGSGTVAKRAALGHLSDFIESVDGEILWVIPLSENMAKPLGIVADHLWEDQARYMLVTDETVEDADWEESAESIVTTESDVFEAVVSEVADYGSDDARLIIILDEEFNPDVELVEAAMNAELKVHDLASGLAELEVAEDEEDDETEDETPEDEPEDETPEDEPEDEESEEEGEDMTDELELPERAQKWLDKGNAEKAAVALEKDMSSEDLKAFADSLGVERKKGAWAKTIAKDVIDFLIYQEAGDIEDDAPEPEPEEKPKPAKKAATKEDPEEEPEPEVDVEVAKNVPKATTVHPIEVVHVLATVANTHDVAEAKKFYAFLKDEGLLG